MLIYGAYGYTGSLIVEQALEQGLRPFLSGRDSQKLAALAERYGLPYQAFDLKQPEVLDRALKDQRLVLNCAGPFSQTHRPVAEACLRQGAQYLDITGEIEVFEALATLDHAAKQAGVMLLPGVGFDVVPTDCLAAHLRDRLPSADNLELALRARGGLSRGTRHTILQGLGQGGAVRRAGQIERVPAAWKVKRVDFGEHSLRKVVSIPWGDVATAWYSTGIPNITTYAALRPSQIRALRLSRYFGWWLRTPMVRAQLSRRIENGPSGPDAATRRSTENIIWGEVCNSNGASVQSRLRCSNGYSFTARAAVAAARRVLAGDFKPGFQTPSRAYGIGFVLSLGARIIDLP